MMYGLGAPATTTARQVGPHLTMVQTTSWCLLRQPYITLLIFLGLTINAAVAADQARNVEPSRRISTCDHVIGFNRFNDRLTDEARWVIAAAASEARRNGANRTYVNRYLTGQKPSGLEAIHATVVSLIAAFEDKVCVDRNVARHGEH